MNPGRIGCELSVMAVLCILTIFLFPAMQGPYSVVHGPASALLAARYAARLRTSIVHAGCRLLGDCGISPLCVCCWMSLHQAELHQLSLPDCGAILRC
jgi:hypothetical protein